MKHSVRHPSLRLALSAVLAFASGTAAALGLGQIEVRSRPGQPLLAEIPVISSDPAELEFLQAQLASPETFARIGLRPPEGAAADLQFTVGTGRYGRPVIRVTTEEPVNEPMLTFLVEVDWGQGRLVREYSALIDTPRAVAAPAQPPIQAPLPAPSNVIERPARTSEAVVEAEPRPQTGDGAGAATAPADRTSPSEYGPVRRGDTLSKIAHRVGLDGAQTIDQAMIALLRANPEAFIGGDINQLKRGAVLRIPSASEVASIDASQAAAVVRDRMRQWRAARREASSAAVAAATTPASRTDAAAENAGAAAPPRPAAPKPRTPPSTTSRTVAPVADARLEIAPPAASRATRAGTQTGIEAGGEGQMLRQELQQTRETLAARDAELQDLKSRIAELEKLQTDQQRLLSMRDSELAAAQQRLATTAQAAPAQAQETRTPARDSVLPWLLGAAALLALLFGGWWLRRRSDARPAFRAPAASSAPDLAAAFPLRDTAGPEEDLLVVQPPAEEQRASLSPIASSHAPHPGTRGAADSAERAPGDQGARSSVNAPAPTGVAVPQHSAEPTSRLAAPEAASRPEHAPAASAADATQPAALEPEVQAITAAPRPAAPTPLIDTPAPAPAPVNERIELAQAYLELGDHDSARQLLGEVAVTGDHSSRQQAIRLLRSLDSP